MKYSKEDLAEMQAMINKLNVDLQKHIPHFEKMLESGPTKDFGYDSFLIQMSLQYVAATLLIRKQQAIELKEMEPDFNTPESAIKSCTQDGKINLKMLAINCFSERNTSLNNRVVNLAKLSNFRKFISPEDFKLIRSYINSNYNEDIFSTPSS